MAERNRADPEGCSGGSGIDDQRSTVSFKVSARIRPVVVADSRDFLGTNNSEDLGQEQTEGHSVLRKVHASLRVQRRGRYTPARLVDFASDLPRDSLQPRQAVSLPARHALGSNTH